MLWGGGGGAQEGHSAKNGGLCQDARSDARRPEEFQLFAVRAALKLSIPAVPPRKAQVLSTTRTVRSTIRQLWLEARKLAVLHSRQH